MLISCNTILSANLSYENYISEKYGNYTGVVKINTIDDLEKSFINNHCQAMLSTYGVINSPKSIYDKQLSVGYIDNIEDDSIPIKLVSGRLPISQNEIVVEQSLGEKLLLNLSVDKDVIINITTSTNDSVSQKFHIVGVINDYSFITGMTDDDIAIWPSILLSKESISNFNFQNNYAILSDISANNLNDLSSKYNLNCYINPRYIENSMLSIISESTTIIFIILFSCGILVTILCICAYMMVSESETVEHYKNLKILGAGSSVIIIFAVLRTLLIFLISLIFGYLLGFIGNYAFGKYIIGKFISIYNIGFTFDGVVIGTLLPFILIILIVVIRIIPILIRKPLQIKAKHNLYKSRNIRIKNIITKWFLVLWLNNKKAYIGIILEMCVCYFITF